MRVVACLSWFDENPHMLAELVTSLGKAQIDHLVAVDGAYRLFPGNEVWSGGAEYEALQNECRAWSIDLTFHTPAGRYDGNEIEKRNRLFRLGHAVAEPYDDWLWVIDADEMVVRAEGLRETLATAGQDVARVTQLPSEHGSPEIREPRLFRAHPRGIKVERHHSCYVNGDGEMLWKPRGLPTLDLDVSVAHRPLARSGPRTAARNGYYAAVKEHKAEMDVF